MHHDYTVNHDFECVTTPVNEDLNNVQINNGQTKFTTTTNDKQYLRNKRKKNSPQHKNFSQIDANKGTCMKPQYLLLSCSRLYKMLLNSEKAQKKKKKKNSVHDCRQLNR